MKDLSALNHQLQIGSESERWAAAAELGEYVYEHPAEVWPLVLRHGSSEVEDMRSAIATNVLEHILEHHFDKFFPLLEQEILKGNENLRATLRLCWKFGQSLDPARARRWEALSARPKSG